MMRTTCHVLSLALVALLAGCASSSSGCKRGAAAEGEKSPTGGKAYHGIIQYRAKDAKEAITDPVMVDPDEVLLAAGSKVIGVFVNGEARAYPLDMLKNHQVVNDMVGGKPVACSY